MSKLIYPKATVRYISSHGNRPLNTPLLMILHTNAGGGSSASTWNYIQNQLAAGNTSVTQPHFQLPFTGIPEQYLDSNEKGVASYQAEGRCISIETQDYGTNSDGTIENDPWTPEQVETLADMFAWGHKEGFWPLQMAKVPLPERYEDGGLGWHSMWGTTAATNPWTKHNGKTCPGAHRISQVQTIHNRAIQIVGTLPPPTPVRRTKVYFIVQPIGSSKVYLTDYMTKRHIQTGEEFQHYKNLAVLGYPYVFDGQTGNQILVDPVLINNVPTVYGGAG